MNETDNFYLLKNNDFSNEKELKEYILEHKEYFCEKVLGVKYKKHISEYRFKSINMLHDNEPRVDLVFVDSDDFVHFVELKNPENAYGDCMSGIGQCLAYYYLARVNKINIGSVYLISTKHSNLAPLIIRDNDLKIKYVYMDKTVIAHANI